MKSVSQAGARGYLDDLREAIEAGLPGETLQMNETDTEGLSAQAVSAVVPDADAGRPRDVGHKSAQHALQAGGQVSEGVRRVGAGAQSGSRCKERYDFTVQIAVAAIKEYRYWETHPAWNGRHLHEKSKSANGGAPKGGGESLFGAVLTARSTGWRLVCFSPIMSALSAFVVQKDGKWAIEKPSLFDADQMIDRAVKQYRALDRQVAYMGRSEAAYDALSIYTDTIASVMKSQSA